MTIDATSADLDTISLNQLLQIARENEAEVVELKDNILNPAEISDYIAQFSNNRGSLLIFGLNDDGTISGKIKQYGKNHDRVVQNVMLTTV